MTSEGPHPYLSLPPNWDVARLKDLTTKIGSGATPRGGKNAYVDKGVHLIRSQNVHDLRFNRDGLAHITDDAADKLAGVEVQPGDVLLNITGASIARCCQAPEWVLPARVNQHVAILRPSQSLDARFLMYLFVHPEMRAYVLSHNAGASREAITKRHIEGLLVPVPPIEEQRAIAEVLGALDDRIELLVAREALGYGLQDALFEALLTDVDGRRELGELVSLDKGVSYKGAHVVEDAGALPLINLGNFGRGRGPRWEKLKRYEGPTKPRHHVRPGDVVVCATDMTHDRVVLGKALIVPDELEHACVTHHLYALRLQDDVPVSHWLVALALNHEPIRRRVATYANGTTVLSLPRDAIHRVEVPVPSLDELAQFDDAVESLQRLIEQAGNEATTLRAARDLLLEQLLSGELRIEDPTRLLGAVA